MSEVEGTRPPRPALVAINTGRYLLELGHPAGTLVERLTDEEVTPLEPLVKAAKDWRKAARPSTEHFEEAVDDAAATTGQAERALTIFTALVEGRSLDLDVLPTELDALLDALERLDRQEKHQQALKLARSLVSLLALLGRWQRLFVTLRIAYRAADALNDDGALAWVLHEVGTFSLAAGQSHQADQALSQALALREHLGDNQAAAQSRHNLELARDDLRERSGISLRRALSRAALKPAAAVAAALAIGAAGVGTSYLAFAGTTPSATTEITRLVTVTHQMTTPLTFTQTITGPGTTVTTVGTTTIGLTVTVRTPVTVTATAPTKTVTTPPTTIVTTVTVPAPPIG